MTTRTPDQMIERALVRIRRDQQARLLQRASAEESQPAGSSASAARFRYLDALEAAGDALAISAIAEAIDVDRPRASRLTAALVGEGLIERDRAPEDSRYSLIRLTQQGRDLVARVQESRRRRVVEALEGFSDEEAAQFARLLERFVDAWPRPR